MQYLQKINSENLKEKKGPVVYKMFSQQTARDRSKNLRQILNDP